MVYYYLEKILVPRVFRLLAELEKGGSAFYTYGLEKGKNFKNL